MFKKLVKFTLILLLLLIILAGALLIPSVQRTLFLWAANTADREIKVESIYLLPGSLTVKGFELNQEDLAVRAPSLNLRFSPLALFNRTIQVNQLEAKGFDVKVRESEEEKDTPTILLLPPDFDGFLAFDWGLDLSNIDLAGTVALENISIVRVTAGTRAIHPGTTGNFTIEITPDDPQTSPIPEATIRIPVTLSESGRIDKVELAASLKPRLTEQAIPLRLNASLERQADGDEIYQISFAGAEDAGGVDTIEATLHGNWSRSKNLLSLSFDLNVHTLSQLEALTEEKLPDLSLHAKARTSLVPGTRSWSVDLETEAEWTPDEEIGLQGPVELAALLSIESSSSGEFTLRRMNAKVLPSDSEEPWLVARLLQPQVLSPERLQELPEDTFASLDLDVPGKVLETFLPDWNVGNLKGGWLLTGSNGVLLVEPKKNWSTALGRKDSGAAPASVTFHPKIEIREASEVAISLSLIQISSANGPALNSSLSAKYRLGESGISQIELQTTGNLEAIRPLLPPDSPSFQGKLNLQLAGDVTEAIGFSGYLKLDDFSLEGAPAGQVEMLLESLHWSLPENKGEFTLSGTLKNSMGANEFSKLHATVQLHEDKVPEISLPESRGSLDIDSLLAWLPVPEDADVGDKSGETSLADAIKSEIYLPININAIAGQWVIQHPSLPEPLQLVLSGDGPYRGETRTLTLSIAPSSASATPWAKANIDLRLDSEGLLERIASKIQVSENAYVKPLPAFFLQAIYQRTRPEEWIYLRMASSENSPTLLTASIAPTDNKVRITNSIDLSALSQSPFRTILPNLQTGQLSANWSLQENTLQGTLTVESLSPRNGWQSYHIQTETDLSWQPTLSLQSKVSLKEARSEKSVVTIKADSSRNTSQWDIFLESTALVLDEWTALADIFQTGTLPQLPPSTTSPTSPVQPAAASAWPLAGMEQNINIEAKLDSIILSQPKTRISRIHVLSHLSAEKGTLRATAGLLSNATLNTEIDIQPGGAGIFSRISTKAGNVSLSELFRLLKPEESPPITGTASLDLSLQGSAENLETLADMISGNVRVDIRDGVIRSLNPEDRIGRIAQVGSLAGSILGQVIDRPGIGALSQVIDLFSSIPYQSITLQLRREEDQSTAIQSLRLRGNYLSLDGSGKIQPSSLEHIPLTPMEMNLSLGSRPPLTRPLEILDLSGKEDTADNYRKWKKPYRITGTLTEPNMDGLWDDIAGAAERAATVRSRDIETPAEKKEGEDEKKKQKPEEQLIEQGINELFRIIGR